MAANNPLYRVDFTFDDSYRPTTEVFRNISLIVRADSQFGALSIAWNKLATLNLPESKSFSATRIDKET